MKLFGSAHAKGRGREEWQDSPEAVEEQDVDRETGDVEEYEDYEDYEEEYEEYDEDYEEYEDEEYEDDEEPGGIRGFFHRMSSTTLGFLTAFLTVLVVFGIGVLVVNHFLSMINFQAADSDYFQTVQTAEALPSETPVSQRVAELEEEDNKDLLEATPEEMAQWDAHIENVISDDETYEVPFDQDVYNILLVGTDVRELSEAGRSDAMILVSINQKSQTIYLTSFLRDCYVHIPGWGNTKLNHAFAYGGPALLEETLEENFKIHVDRYVAVNFYSFMDVVDTLGGVYLYVSDEEREVTNDYIWSMNNLLGEEWSTDYLWSSGWHKMNGKQTLAYARNRYVGNDYQRTQRQRTVLNQIFNGAKSAPASTLVQLAQVILPQVTTDMTKTQVLTYAANLGAYMNYDVVSQQIPAAGTYYGAMVGDMSVISLDLDENITYLQGTIYSGNAAQTAEDFGDGEEDPWADYDPNVFWGRAEWADIDWEQVDWDQVDWYNIDYDTVDWTDYYKKEDATPKTTTQPTSATPKPKTSAKPSPTPSPTPTAAPSRSPSLNEDDTGD